MTSINTNRAAMAALASLQMTGKNLEETEGRISTGMRVNTAQDNAAYWSIATTMKSDNSSLSSVKDALGLGAATADVTYTALNVAIGAVTQIKDKLVAALQPGVDHVKMQADITALQTELKSTADSANFNGDNWLSVDSSAAGYNAQKSVIASFTRTGTGLSIQTINFDDSTSKLYDSNSAASPKGILDGTTATTSPAPAITFSVATLNISTLTTSTNDSAAIQQMINWVDGALSKMTTAAANVGALKSQINSQSSFVQSLMDAITRGVGTLVDADMSQESTKLQALQVQQQLGTQALSIANQSTQSILALFK